MCLKLISALVSNEIYENDSNSPKTGSQQQSTLSFQDHSYSLWERQLNLVKSGFYMEGGKNEQ